jgi:hypothetical protein
LVLILVVLEETRQIPLSVYVVADLDNVGRMTSLFKPKESAVAPSEVQADINIFTVASGLLYEVRRAYFCAEEAKFSGISVSYLS